MITPERLNETSEVEALKDLFHFCYTTDLLTLEERMRTLSEIVHSSLRDGTWDAFTQLYEGNAWAEFIGKRSSAEKLGIVERALEYSTYPAYTIAEHFIGDMQPEDQKKAYRALGVLAAKAGDVEGLYRYVPDPNETHDEQLAYAFMKQDRWDELRDLVSYKRVSTYALITASKATAKTGRFDDVLLYLADALKQSPDPSRRSDPETGSWIDKAVPQIITSALTHNQLSFEIELPSALEWPKDVDIFELVRRGIQSAARQGNHDAAITHYIDIALRAGEDPGPYGLLQQAMAEDNWGAICLLAPQLNSEVLTMLQAKARYEKNVNVARELYEQSRRRGSYSGHEIFFADDSSPLIQDMAKLGDWEQALTLLPGAPKLWFDELMMNLAETAVAQNRTDIVLQLIERADNGPYYINRFLHVLTNARKFVEADALYATMCDCSDDLPERIQTDLPWMKLDLLQDMALYAVYDGDYNSAREHLEELGRYIPLLADKYGFRSDGRTFEFIGYAILKKVQDYRLSSV